MNKENLRDIMDIPEKAVIYAGGALIVGSFFVPALLGPGLGLATGGFVSLKFTDVFIPREKK